MTVLSALGEPLRAEIEVPDINSDEAASLKASVASPEAFRAAGLDYNPAMSTLQATLQRRPDGRAYLRLSSDRAINDPFVDMILEASWSSGRIVRDYTMLFDPPSLKQAAPVSPTQAQVPAQAPAVGPTPPRAVTAAPSVAPASPALDRKRPAPSAPARPAAVVKEPSPTTSDQVTVKSGDTASKIAAATKPSNISLDQMLVALLRANPSAFLNGNVNRVKAGAVLNVPTADQAGATPAAEASQLIVAQSKDFNDFRRKLAGNAPSTPVAAADRQTSGTVQAKVEDKKPSTAAPDKLTLSKGTAQGKTAEDQLAQDRSAKESAARAAEIAKNISDLSKLGAASSAAAASPAKPPAELATAASAPAAMAPAVTVAAPAQPASAVASATVAPTEVAAAASAPQAAASTPPKRIAPVVVPQPEPSLVDGLLEDPLVPAGAVGLIALLAGFGVYRHRQRKKENSQVDSSFLESRLQPESFFGASGGQSVDTSDGSTSSSSLAYTPSQLDAVDDVDPVAEADVYLAYGRDLQAEEILKAALRTSPGRLAIHQKLLEIFAKRRDVKAFESTATEVFKFTGSSSPDWERVCELGLSIDPGNSLYQPGGQPGNSSGTPSQLGALDFTNPAELSATPTIIEPNEPQAAGSLDLDLDLDFSLDEMPASSISEATASYQPIAASARNLEFETSTQAMGAYDMLQPEATPEAVEPSLPDLDLDMDDLPAITGDIDEFKMQAATSFGTTAPAPLPSIEADDSPTTDLGMLEFDLGELSLELEDNQEAERTTEPGLIEDPLATKLALAEEFSAIGDDDGARALIEEVISEASGDMKAKAQRALSKL